MQLLILVILGGAVVLLSRGKLGSIPLFQKLLLLGVLCFLVGAVGLGVGAVNRSLARQDLRESGGDDDFNEHSTNADVADTVAKVAGGFGLVLIASSFLLRSNSPGDASPNGTQSRPVAAAGKPGGFCTSCGTPTVKGAAFCGTCGAALQQS